ncbi:MAG: UTP--glucose-1-phosphate uridylyltransferase GalU [Candidatus Tectomicrobia bacterium]|nr:UTP--glucose-1-phosphate uridylyltransferase GalU [Candidatus Tectomicrobia bacterium]
MKVRKAVFPVAGLGTRFLPATKASPKEMLPLLDKPLIQYAVEEAKASGIDEVIFVTGRGKRAIEDHFDVSVELEQVLEKKGQTDLLEQVRAISNMVQIVYVRQKEALGLGHAILCARDVVGDEPFAVILGDDIIDSERPVTAQAVDLFQERGGSVVAVEAIPRERISAYGVIAGKRVQNRVWRVQDLVEKPVPEEAPSELAVIGRYVLTPEIFDILRKTKPDRRGEIQLTDALRHLCRESAVFGLVFEGRRYDAGNILGFLEATVELALKRPDLSETFRNYLKGLAL